MFPILKKILVWSFLVIITIKVGSESHATWDRFLLGFCYFQKPRLILFETFLFFTLVCGDYGFDKEDSLRGRIND